MHGDGSAVFHARLEAPFLDGFDGFLIEAQAERADHFEIPRIPLLVDDDKQDDGALEFRLARFLGIFRLHLEDNRRRRNTTPNAVRAPTNVAAGAWTEARPVS